jgi:lipopolysaccharide export system protein LptA
MSFFNKYKKFRWFFTAAAAFVFALLATGVFSSAQEEEAEDKIQVSADQLITENEKNVAEFVGNVIASQGAFVVTSDRLKVYYKEGLGEQEDNASTEESIKKIVAIGNVRLISEDKVASADRAVYFVKNKALVLTGEEAKVSSGKNVVTGSKITFFRAGGRIRVERSAQKRVKMLLYSKRKGEEDQSPKRSVTDLVDVLEDKALESPAGVQTASKTPETSADDEAPVETPMPVIAEEKGGAMAEIVDQTVAGEQKKEKEKKAIELASVKPDYEAKTEPAAPSAQEQATDDGKTTKTAVSDKRTTTDESSDKEIPPGQRVAPDKKGTAKNIKDTAMLTAALRSGGTEKKEPGPVKKDTATADEPQGGPADDTIEVAPSDGVEAPEKAIVAKTTGVTPEIPIENYVAISLGDLKNKVGITALENNSFCDDGTFKSFQENLFSNVYQSCPNHIFIKPGNPDSPDYLKSLPRLATGRIDNIALAKMGRKVGLNTIVTGSLINIGAAHERRSVLWMKNTKNIARIVLMIEVFDTATGMKLLNESFVKKLDVDEVDYETLKKKRMPDIPIIKEALQEVAAAAAKKIGLTLHMQPWKGHVTSISGESIIISSGSDIGLKQNNILEVFDQNVIKGTAGHQFYLPGPRTGLIRLVKVHPDKSEAVLVYGSSISEGSSVRPLGASSEKGGGIKRFIPFLSPSS